MNKNQPTAKTARDARSAPDNTIRFHDVVDGDWLLLDQQLIAIGNGSFHAEGRLFSEDGRLVASFGQSGIIRFPST